MNKLKVVTLFSGIGAQESALNKLEIPYEIVGYSEIDKFAIKSYTCLYGEQPALGDITKIEELPECDLCTYSFPCTDISIGGDKKGLIDENGNKTRSGLLLDVERLLDVAKAKNTLPKILLMENVKNLVGKKFKPDFDRWLSKLEELGYENYWQILNAKDYGIPQNRERVFVVSFLKELHMDKYEFPAPFKLEKRLADVLETNVPESYYLSQQIIDKIKKSNFHSEADRVLKGDYSYALRARDFKDPLCIEEPFIVASRGRYVENPSANLVGEPTEQRLEANKEGISNTLTTVQKDNYVVEPKVMQVANYLEGEGNYWKNPNNGRIYSGEGLAPTLNCTGGGNREPKVITDIGVNDDGFRVRKLTEREYWRLMGFTDEQIDKVKAIGMSKSQMYKQAGNSIVVDVLYYIFKNMKLDLLIK